MANNFERTRHIIFVLVALAVALPLVVRFELPIPPTPLVKAVHDTLESLPPGSAVLIALDYDPAAKEELTPMATALLRHCFRKNLKVVAMTMWVSGLGMAKQLVESVAAEFDKMNGTDFVFLGYRPGGGSLIANMGENLYTAFPKDSYGNATAELPALKDVKSLKDFKYVIDLAAGATIETWIAFGQEKHKFPLGAGCTAVIAPDMYPYIQSGQLNGLMGGLKAAAEYEALIEKRGDAVRRMRPQSVTHVLVVLLVILGNVLYFWTRRKDRQGDRATR
ncbi:MAG: hypothetical protein FJ279_33150 [Planctomycetes bacterium]|nr:hypothetical protein [Planctomycetota bacterium]